MYILVLVTNMADTGTIAQEFPMVPHAADLLSSMESTSTFANGPPANSVVVFLAQIQDADLNLAEFSEDNINTSWGHYQFSGGLTSWNNVGGNDMACQLIAAAIKTCKVARHVCFERDVDPASFLSDSYLHELVEVLWTLWKDAGRVSSFYTYFCSLIIFPDCSLCQLCPQHRQPLHSPLCCTGIHSDYALCTYWSHGSPPRCY
jgi:hypothetical protein